MKHNILYFTGAVCGVAGGIMMITAGFIGDAFPKPLWLAASLCLFYSSATQIMNCRQLRKKLNPEKDSGCIDSGSDNGSGSDE